MGDTKETNTVHGAGNATYATQGGYGPGPELEGDPSAPAKDDRAGKAGRASESEPRQEATATIRSNVEDDSNDRT